MDKRTNAAGTQAEPACTAQPTAHPERTFDRKKLLMMSIGTFVGSGLVSLLGVAAGHTGYSVWLAYLVAIVIGFLSALPFLCLSSMMNFQGGTYSIACTFLGKTFGGAYIVLLVLNALILSIMGTAFGSYVNSVFPSVSAQWSGFAILILFWAVNCIGVDFMASIQKHTTYILLAALAVFCAVAYSRLNPAALDFGGPDFFQGGLSGFMSAVVLLIFSCQSYDNNVYVFGKYTINPRKNMPWAMVATFVVLIVVYCGVGIAAVGAVDLEAFAGKPLTEAARAILPGFVFVAFIVLGPILCLTTTVNGALGSFTVGLAKASEDGWFPTSFSERNRRGAPWKIISLLIGVCLVPIILNVNIGMLTSITVLLGSLLHIPLLISFWRMPEKFPEPFANSTLHLSKGVYHATIVVALAARLVITVVSISNLTAVTAIGSLIAAAGCFLFSYLRYRTGKPKVEMNYFFD